jgi:hypothetical protein
VQHTLQRVLDDGDDTLKLFRGEVTGALAEIDIGLLADQVGVAATDTLDLGQGVHDLLLSIDVRVQQTDDVLEAGGGQHCRFCGPITIPCRQRRNPRMVSHDHLIQHPSPIPKHAVGPTSPPSIIFLYRPPRLPSTTPSTTSQHASGNGERRSDRSSGVLQVRPIFDAKCATAGSMVSLATRQ